MTHGPEADEIAQLASKLGFSLTLDEAEIYSRVIGVLEGSMADLADREEDRPPTIQTVRDAGVRPNPEEDPYNCFIRRCFVKGSPGGPLTGRRAGLKDHISVAGVPLTLGSRFMDGYVPLVDATVVTRLLEAGADIVGKLNMDEFSHGVFNLGTDPESYGRSRNPEAPDHVSGGSSSGPAVAVASGAVDLAIGGGQGGSIRIPAAWCGVVGFKPTHGLVPHTGVVGIDPVLDHIGPMARTVADVASMLDVIAGPDGYDPRQADVPPVGQYTEGLPEGLQGVQIGVLREGFGDEDAESEVEDTVRAAADTLYAAGATIKEVSVPEHLVCGRIGPVLLFLVHDQAAVFAMR